jgi:cysteinyl-tRNA synthetase
MNTELVLTEGRKMSRSYDNALLLSELRYKGYTGRDIRFFLMGVNYRKPLNYSEVALETAKNTIRKINTFIYRIQAIDNDGSGFVEIDQIIYDLNNGFNAAMDDDLNIAGALAALFNFVGKVNLPLLQGLISQADSRKILEALGSINQVLGIMDFDIRVAREEVQALVGKRQTARNARNWQEADKLRDKLAELGVEVLDAPSGTIWHFR